MLRGKASPVHTVLMRGGEACIGENGDDFTEAAEALCFVLVAAPGFLRIGHHANDLGAETLHTRDGALDFAKSDVEVAGDGFGPVADEGAEFGDGDACFVELIGDGVEFVFGQFVNVAAVHSASGDFVPANFLGRFDLSGEVLGRFVGKSGEIHAGVLAEGKGC